MWRAEYCGLRCCLLPCHQATRLLATGAWVLSHTLTARGHPMGPLGRRGNGLFLEHSSTLSLGLSISFWMLQCRLTQACCLQIKEPECLAELAVSSHELHIFTNRETYLVKRNHEAASEVAAGHRSVREARGLGNYLAVAASKCGRGAWVWSSKQHWKEACGLCHVTVETPARAK